MKQTYNYNIDLMLPNGANKDIIFNEAISKIDSLLNVVVTGFIDEAPSELPLDTKYIITDGKDSNKICYAVNNPKNVQLLPPRSGMLVFIFKEQHFYIFMNNKWQQIKLK